MNQKFFKPILVGNGGNLLTKLAFNFDIDRALADCGCTFT